MEIHTTTTDLWGKNLILLCSYPYSLVCCLNKMKQKLKRGGGKAPNNRGGGEKKENQNQKTNQQNFF